MAIPVISGYTSSVTAPGGSSFSFNPNDNIVSGTLTTDDWIVFIMTASSGTSVNMPTPSAGWMTIVPFAGVGSGTTSFGVWAIKYTSGTYTWGQGTGAGNGTMYRMFFVRDALDISNWIIGAFDFRQNTGTSTTNVAAGVTTTTYNNLAVVISEDRTTLSETSAQVTCTNFTKLYFDNVFDSSIMVGTKSMPEPGPTGSSTITYPNTHNNNGIAGIVSIPGPDTEIPLMWVI